MLGRELFGSGWFLAGLRDVVFPAAAVRGADLFAGVRAAGRVAMVAFFAAFPPETFRATVCLAAGFFTAASFAVVFFTTLFLAAAFPAAGFRAAVFFAAVFFTAFADTAGPVRSSMDGSITR